MVRERWVERPPEGETVMEKEQAKTLVEHDQEKPTPQAPDDWLLRVAEIAYRARVRQRKVREDEGAVSEKVFDKHE